MIKLTKPIQILVKRRAAIGDVIMTTGVVRELKRKYNDNANIFVATNELEVYKNNPHIAGVLPYDSIDLTKFDVVYNLDDAYEYNRDIHFVDSYFYRVFGDANVNKAVELFPDNHDINHANEIISGIDGNYIVVHMRNWHWGAKNISMDVWFDVFIKLFEHDPDLKVITVGGPTDHSVEHPNFIDLRGSGVLNSQVMKLLCDESQCFVGIDSGPFQCAAASNTKIIALLTHLRPERIVPYRMWELGNDVTAIQTLEDCRGCADRQQLPVRQINCEKGNYPCTGNFDTDAIAQAIIKQL